MVFLNEFLPNPAGSDAGNEWIELWNGGNTAVNLSGWKIVDQGGKNFSLSGTIGAGEYLVLPRAKTKLTLRNTDGKLSLYDAGGKLADEASFLGAAPEGKSLARRSLGEGGSEFIFAEPTPGAKNVFAEVGIARATYPLGQPLRPQIGWPQVLGMAIGTALVLAALVMIVLERNENIKNLFFSRKDIH